MPSFGVDSTYGVTAPSGFLQSSERSVDVEIATIKGADGKVIEAIKKPRSITTVTVKTKGSASLTTVAAGDMSGMTVTSSKYAQTNDDFGTSEITGTLYA
jgi:hypothetical protein